MFVPGFKIGFANLVSLLTLMLWDIPSMWCVALLRDRISFSLMMGTIFSVSFWLSLSGGFLSLIMMTIFKKAKVFSIYGISVIGACFPQRWPGYYDNIDIPAIFYAVIFADIIGFIYCKWLVDCDHQQSGLYKSTERNGKIWRNLIISQKRGMLARLC